MGSLLRYLVIALFIVLIGSWLFTVAKSCNAPKTVTSTLENVSPSRDGDLTEETGSTDEDSELEDLYEVDESDVKDGNADRSTGENTLPDNLDAADDLEAGDAGAPDEDPLAVTTPDEKPTTSFSSGSTFGKYLVVTGSYLTETNAKIMAKKLRGMGYDAAEVISFDLSQYYSVTTGRYDGLGEARTVANRVKRKGVEAYVHKMRGKKVNR